jgi:hypothetical protein
VMTHGIAWLFDWSHAAKRVQHMRGYAF